MENICLRQENSRKSLGQLTAGGNWCMRSIFGGYLIFTPSHAACKISGKEKCLEHQRSTLCLLVTTINHMVSPKSPFSNWLGSNIPQLEVLASLQRQLCLCLACCALQSQYHFLGCLCLLLEHGFCLTTITGLLAVVSSLSLGE